MGPRPSKVYETRNALRTKLHGDVRTLNAVRPLDKLAAGGYITPAGDKAKKKAIINQSRGSTDG